MSYQKDRESFIVEMVKHGYTADEARYLMRQATTCERVNYLISSVEMSDREQERVEKQDERAEERARKINVSKIPI